MSVTNSSDLTEKEKSVLVYVAGYLARKAGNKFNCTDCLQLWIQDKDTASGPEYDFLKTKQYEHLVDGGLLCPTDSFVQFVSELEDTFYNHFQIICYETNIVTRLLKVSSAIQLDAVCGKCVKDVEVFLNKLFFRVRIYNTVLWQNRELGESQKSKKRNRKVIKLMHL